MRFPACGHSGRPVCLTLHVPSRWKEQLTGAFLVNSGTGNGRAQVNGVMKPRKSRSRKKEKKKAGGGGLKGKWGLFYLCYRGYDEDRYRLGPGHHAASALAFAA